jgi:hypothetical protein
MCVLYLVIYKKPSFMPRRGRSANRDNNPQRPRSNSNSTQKSAGGSEKQEKKKRSRSTSGRSNAGSSSGKSHNGSSSGKSHHGSVSHAPKELTPEQIKHQKFHKDQQEFVNKVISKNSEDRMHRMLNNIHSNGVRDESKAEAAKKEYKEIGEKKKLEWEDARMTVGYVRMTKEEQRSYDVYLRSKMIKAMTEFRNKCQEVCNAENI